MLTIRREHIKRILILFAVYIIFTSSALARVSFKDSVLRITNSLLPSIFPMMIAAPYLASELESAGYLLSKILKIPQSIIPTFIVGCVCGYPIPAAIIKELYEHKSVSSKNALNAIALFNNTSPAFIINYIGSYVMKSTACGIIMYLSQVISVVIVSRYVLTEENPSRNKSLCVRSLPLQIKHSAQAMIDICAYVLTFSFAADIAVNILPQFSILKPVISGMLEITRGLSYISCAPPFTFALATFMMTVPGICVYFQIKSVTEGLDLKFMSYLKIRLYIFALTLSVAALFLFLLDIINKFC